MAQTHREQLLASRPGLSIAEKVMKLLIGAFLGCTVFRLPCRDHHLPVHFDPKKKAIRPAWTLRLDVRPEAVGGGDAARHLHHLNHTARLVAVASTMPFFQ